MEKNCPPGPVRAGIEIRLYDENLLFSISTWQRQTGIFAKAKTLKLTRFSYIETQVNLQLNSRSKVIEEVFDLQNKLS